MFTIAPWKHSRFWAVYEADVLVAVCVYRRGAVALVARLERKAS